MSISRWMDKKAVVHIHNGILAIKKNSFESVLTRWMKLEPIIQSEVSQKDKHQYSILSMEFKKMVTIALYAKQKKRPRCIEQTFGLCERRRVWDVLREQHWNKYTIKGETDHQPRLDAWISAQGWCTGKTQRDGMGKEVGRGFRMGNTCRSMADLCQCMAKTTTIL